MQKSDDQTPEASFRPSEYTAALVQIILETTDQVRGYRQAIGSTPQLGAPVCFLSRL
jgi:hypothetical protein